MSARGERFVEACEVAERAADGLRADERLRWVGEGELLADDVAGGARHGRNDAARLAEEGVEESALACVWPADEHHDGEMVGGLFVRGGCGGVGPRAGRGPARRKERGDGIAQARESRAERGGGDGDDVFLIGEVDACLHECEQVGQVVGDGLVVARGLAGHDAACAGDLVVVGRADEGGDALGLREGESAVEEGAGGELAGLGGADVAVGERVGDLTEDALDDEGVGGEDEFGGVLAREGARGGERKEEAGKWKAAVDDGGGEERSLGVGGCESEADAVDAAGADGGAGGGRFVDIEESLHKVEDAGAGEADESARGAGTGLGGGGIDRRERAGGCVDDVARGGEHVAGWGLGGWLAGRVGREVGRALGEDSLDGGLDAGPVGVGGLVDGDPVVGDEDADEAGGVEEGRGEGVGVGLGGIAVGADRAGDGALEEALERVGVGRGLEVSDAVQGGHGARVERGG